MNNIRRIYFGGFSLIWTITVAHPTFAAPFDESKGHMFYAVANPIRKTIVPPQGNLYLDAYILALSQASQMNLVADVTDIAADTRVNDFPASDVVKERKWEPSFYNVLGDFGLANPIARLRYDKTTFLLWNRPDVLESARALMATGKTRPLQALPDELELSRQLSDFQRESREKVPPPPDRPHTVKLSEVPAELREKIMVWAHYAILRSNWSRDLMMGEDYWKTARVRAVPTTDPITNQPKSAVFIGGQTENGKTLPFVMPFFVLPEYFDAKLDAESFPPQAEGPVENPAPAPQKTDNEGDLTALHLEAEVALQHKISLEIQRKSLKNVLDEIGRANGLTLTADDATSQIFLTARVEAMPIGTLMGALARVYGASWTKKSDTEFLWQPLNLENWQTLLRRSGQGQFAGIEDHWALSKAQLQEISDLEQEMVDEIKARDPQTPDVAFASLPEDLQTRVRQLAERVAAREIIKKHNKAFLFLKPQSQLALIPDSLHLLMADSGETLSYSTLRAPLPEAAG